MNKHALLPPLLAIVAFIMSPEFYNLLPDKYAHLLAAIAVIAATLLPQLFPSKQK